MRRTVYVIRQELLYEKESHSFSILFGFTDSYEVVRWFGQNQHRFHSKVIVEEWEASSKEDLWERLQEEFALDNLDEMSLFYLEMCSNRMNTLEKPLYTNQGNDISSYAYTFSTLAYEAVVSFVHQMLCMRVNELDETTSQNLMRLLQLVWNYLIRGREDPEAIDGLFHYIDETSLQLDMIEYDDEGDNAYYGY